jgi:putative transposase
MECQVYRRLLGGKPKDRPQDVLRFAEEHFAGLDDKSHARKGLRKVDVSVVQEIKKLSENPDLGAYRVSAALEQMGIKLSPSTCGRYLAINRRLYHLQTRSAGKRTKKVMPYKAVRRHQYWTTGIRYIDMHHLPGEDRVYCISILENFSRAILASAISRRQDSESYIAVLYAAIRRFGVPEVLVSDSGGVFRSHDVMRIYDQLGIQKEQIPRGKPWTSYIETAFNVQRRLADWNFERAQTWEDLLAAHEKWLRDYNYQKHQAHDDREDGAHSPAAVLGWVKSVQPEPQLVYRVFSAVGELRTINKAGYVRFRDFWLYGEHNLAGEKTLVNIFQDILTLEYEEQPLTRYSVEWAPDDRHFSRVGNPRQYDHDFQSPQLELWEPGEIEWFVVMRARPYGPRPRHKAKILAFQPPIFPDEASG